MAQEKSVEVFYNVSKDKFVKEINVKVLYEEDICNLLNFSPILFCFMLLIFALDSKISNTVISLCKAWIVVLRNISFEVEKFNLTAFGT